MPVIESEPAAVGRHYRSTLLAVALASGLLPLAVTAPAVDLPALAAALHSGASATQWVQNAYNVVLASTVLAAGSLADRYGRRRVMRIGIAVFGTASLAIAVSWSVPVIDVLRGAQALGAAGILAGGAAVLAHAATGRRRAAAFGLLGASFGAGLALGPLLAGVLAPTGWRTVYLAIAALALVAWIAMKGAAESRDATVRRIDRAGMTVFAAALAGLSSVFVLAPGLGWGSGAVIGLLAVTVALLAAFVLVESRLRAPMFDVRLFRRPAFVAVTCQPFAVAGFVVLLVYLPVYLQGVAGASALMSAVVLLPLTLPVLVVPIAARVLTRRFEVRSILVGAALLMAVGAAVLAAGDPLRGPVRSETALLVFGVGVGLAFSVMDGAALAAVPLHRAGAASGMFNTMRLASESIAVAGSAALLSTLMAHRLGGGRTGARLGALALQAELGGPAVAPAFGQALRLTCAVLAVVALVGGIGTLAALRTSPASGRN